MPPERDETAAVPRVGGLSTWSAGRMSSRWIRRSSSPAPPAVSPAVSRDYTPEATTVDRDGRKGRQPGELRVKNSPFSDRPSVAGRQGRDRCRVTALEGHEVKPALPSGQTDDNQKRRPIKADEHLPANDRCRAALVGGQPRLTVTE